MTINPDQPHYKTLGAYAGESHQPDVEVEYAERRLAYRLALGKELGELLNAFVSIAPADISKKEAARTALTNALWDNKAGIISHLNYPGAALAEPTTQAMSAGSGAARPNSGLDSRDRGQIARDLANWEI